MSTRRSLLIAASLLTLLGTVLGCRRSSGSGASAKELALLNVSYDPTRELYDDVNRAFSAQWAKQHDGQKVRIKQSHGGSGKQARAVLDGLEADVVTLALGGDIDVLATKGQLLDTNWASRLPNDSAPVTSTIVFAVRKGNPKNIRDWDDLVRDGVSVITANPKTSGGARWAYLAAWGQALERANGDESAARAYVTKLFRNVPVLDTGARGATTSFAERGQGDVLLSWENEAALLAKDVGAGKFEVVVPSASIVAEPPVAVVDRYADKHGTRELASAYLQFLYSDEGQEIAAKHHYRPQAPTVLARHAAKFPDVKRFTVKDKFGGWSKAQKTHFDDGGIFDQIATASR